MSTAHPREMRISKAHWSAADLHLGLRVLHLRLPRRALLASSSTYSCCALLCSAPPAEGARCHRTSREHSPQALHTGHGLGTGAGPRSTWDAGRSAGASAGGSGVLHRALLSLRGPQGPKLLPAVGEGALLPQPQREILRCSKGRLF